MNTFSNPNEAQRMESILPISRERNKYKSIVWDEYDTLHQKYLEIGECLHKLLVDKILL